MRINKGDTFITISRPYFRLNGTGISKIIQKIFGCHVHDIHKAINSLIAVVEIIQAFIDKGKRKNIFAILEFI